MCPVFNVSPKFWTVLLNDVTFYVISRHWFINRFVFASDFDSFKTWILQNAQRFGSGCSGFEISMYFYVKVHFQKNFISENKVHCVLNRARTLTIISPPPVVGIMNRRRATMTSDPSQP